MGSFSAMARFDSLGFASYWACAGGMGASIAVARFCFVGTSGSMSRFPFLGYTDSWARSQDLGCTPYLARSHDPRELRLRFFRARFTATRGRQLGPMLRRQHPSFEGGTYLRLRLCGEWSASITGAQVVPVRREGLQARCVEDFPLIGLLLR